MSGVTYQSVINDLRAHATEQYTTLIVDRFRRPKDTRQQMIAAFTDGFNAAINHLVRMEVITMENETTETKGDPNV